MSLHSRRTVVLLPMAFAFALLIGLSAGCTKTDVTPPPPPNYIFPRTRPSDVVKNLQTAYKSRDVVEYSKLLGSDFQFWFDPATREHDASLPFYWTRLQDSTGTGKLFAAQNISNIKIELTYGPDVQDNRIGHEKWRKIDITDTFLSMDKAPEDGGETTTLIVDGDLQAYYLRKGFTEGDTLPGPPEASSQNWYLVEWRDLAGGAGAPVSIARK